MKTRNYFYIIIMISLSILITACTVSSDTINIGEQLSLGEKYLAELDYENAIIAFQKIIEVDPKNVQAYLGLSTAYEKTDRNEEAIEALEKVIEIEPENTDAYIRIANIYIKIDNIQKAIEILQNAYEKLKDEIFKTKLDEIKNNSRNDYEISDENLKFDINTSIDTSSGFNVEIIDEKTAIFYMKENNLQPLYALNRNINEDNRYSPEYQWSIEFEYNNQGYEINTMSGRIEDDTELSIDEMEHAFWIEKDEGDGGRSITSLFDIGFKSNDNTLAWKVIIPGDIDIDFYKIKDYRVNNYYHNYTDKNRTNNYNYEQNYYRDDSGNISIISGD